MKHYIIVKFNENVEKEKLINPIKELFQKAMYIKEVMKVDIYESNMDLPNRYDLMIKNGNKYMLHLEENLNLVSRL